MEFSTDVKQFEITKTTFISSGLRRQGREPDHSPPSSVQVKNDGPVLPLPYTCLWRLKRLCSDSFLLKFVAENNIKEGKEVFCCCNNDGSAVSFLLLCREQDEKGPHTITDAFVVHFQLLETNTL
jgi:hypothetical protein